MPGYLHRHTAKTTNNSNRFPGRRPGESMQRAVRVPGRRRTIDCGGRRRNVPSLGRQKYETLTTEEYPNLMLAITKRYPNRKSKQDGHDGWEITLTLNFIVPLVRGVAGVWQFSTKGTASTIPQIRETFDGMLAERGFCKGIIFDLNVQFATTQKPGDRSRFPVVSLVPNESADNVLKVRKAWEPAKQLDNE